MRLPLASLGCSIVALTAGFAVSRVGGWSISAEGVDSTMTPGQPETRLPGVNYQSVGEFLTLCEQPSTLQRDHDLFLALRQMSGEDFSKAVEDVPSLVERLHRLKQPFRGQVVEAAMRRWMEVDAEGALEWLGGLPSLAANDSALKGKKIDWWSLGRIFPVIARVRPEWLRAQIDPLTDKEGRRQAIEALLKETAGMNPAGANQWLDGFSEADERKAALRGMLSGLAEADPQVAAAILSKVSRQEGRDELISGFVTALAKYRPTAASEWIGKMEDSSQRTRIGWQAASTIAQESALDPIAFLEQTLSKKEINTLASAGSLWWLVERDAIRAADWAKGLEDKNRAVLTGVLSQWVTLEPGAALEWISKLPVDSLPPASRDWDYALGQLASSAPAAFESWLDTLPEGELRDRSRLLLATRFVNEANLPEATRIFAQGADLPAAVKVAREFGEALAAQDATASAAWVSTLPAGDVQTNAASGVATAWARRDIQAVAGWIETMAAGKARDAATASMMEMISQTDPKTASHWAEGIQDPASRAMAASNVYYAWRWQEPATALEWIKKFEGIDEITRAKLLSNRR
jgi:hypothetical protein